MFLFAPLGLLPGHLGVAVYLLLSWGVFVFGCLEFSSIVLRKPKREVLKLPIVQFFWIAIAPQMWTAITAEKIEILSVGLLFFSAAWIIEKKHLGIVALILSMLVNWKYHTVSTVGLLALAWIFTSGEVALFAWIFCGLVFWYMAPLSFMSWKFFVETQTTWNLDLAEFTHQTWDSFDNVYAFLRNSLGVKLSYFHGQVLTLIFGLGAVFTQWKHRPGRESVAYALAIGGWLTALFSPLSQNNSYILLAPLVWLGILSIAPADKKWKPLLQYSTAAYFLVMALAYSDIVPKPARDWMRFHSIKPLAGFCYGLLIAIYPLISRRPLATALETSRPRR
jgi:hypothetical protein